MTRARATKVQLAAIQRKLEDALLERTTRLAKLGDDTEAIRKRCRAARDTWRSRAAGARVNRIRKIAP